MRAERGHGKTGEKGRGARVCVCVFGEGSHTPASHCWGYCHIYHFCPFPCSFSQKIQGWVARNDRGKSRNGAQQFAAQSYVPSPRCSTFPSEPGHRFRPSPCLMLSSPPPFMAGSYCSLRNRQNGSRQERDRGCCICWHQDRRSSMSGTKPWVCFQKSGEPKQAPG